MKKSLKPVLYLALFFTTFVNAQWYSSKTIKGNGNLTTEKRTTADYDEIEITGFFDIQLISGKEGNLTIEGEVNILPLIKTYVENGVLKISIEKNKNISTRKKLLITIPFESLNAISLVGSGEVTSNATIKSTRFSSRLTGSGDINLTIEASAIELALSGSGTVKLTGKTNDLKVRLAGSGNVATDALKAENVETNVAGSGDAEVYCSNTLKARVTGSGDIYYKGNPKIKNTKVTGSGNIFKR